MLTVQQEEKVNELNTKMKNKVDAQTKI